jgi:hypothetical protein
MAFHWTRCGGKITSKKKEKKIKEIKIEAQQVNKF